MRRFLVVLAVAALGVVGTFGTSFAGSGPDASGTFKDGPYTATTADSGCAGNNWAQDLFVRNFVVTLPGSGGNFAVTEKFAKGHFSTYAGDSPGGGNSAGCTTNTGGQIKSGVSGKFSGTFSMTVSGGTFDPNGSCVLTSYPGWDQCDTAGWVEGFFGPSATYTVDHYSFSYHAGGQGLQYHDWTNSDAGNSGDIAVP